MVTTTETAAASAVGAEGTAPTAVTLTTEGDAMDLEVAMFSQGDDDDDVYGKKYHTTSEDRTDRSAARVKQKEDCEKQEKERVALQYAEAQLRKEVKEWQKQEAPQVSLFADPERILRRLYVFAEEPCKSTTTTSEPCSPVFKEAQPRPSC